MPSANALEICRKHLFSDLDDLNSNFPPALVQKVLRVRDMYLWFIQNPSAKDRVFIEEDVSRYSVSRPSAYDDLKIIKAILPNVAQSTRDFNRWRYQEMILETYKMARDRKDAKTMERAASSYAKYCNIDKEDEQAVPFHLIVVQPFTATDDPRVLGIEPIPCLQQKIDAMLAKYRKETIDIDDVEFEEADLEMDSLFLPANDETDN